MWWVNGRSRGRPLKSASRATELARRGSAATPYTVSVGSTTSASAAIMRAARATARRVASASEFLRSMRSRGMFDSATAGPDTRAGRAGRGQRDCRPFAKFATDRATRWTPAAARRARSLAAMNPEPTDTRARTLALARLGELLAGFAHEVRNPLSTIGLNLQLIREDFAEAESPRDRRTHKRLSVVEAEVRRLQEIVEE